MALTKPLHKHVPLLLHASTVLAFLLFGHVLGVAYRLLACTLPSSMPVLSYLVLPMRDGTALAAAGLPLDLSTALACSGVQGAASQLGLARSPAECAAVLPLLK